MINRCYFVKVTAIKSNGDKIESWRVKPFKSWLALPMSEIINDMVGEIANLNNADKSDFVVNCFSRVK